jgi:hypothetical protein
MFFHLAGEKSCEAHFVWDRNYESHFRNCNRIFENIPRSYWVTKMDGLGGSQESKETNSHKFRWLRATIQPVSIFAMLLFVHAYERDIPRLGHWESNRASLHAAAKHRSGLHTIPRIYNNCKHANVIIEYKKIYKIRAECDTMNMWRQRPV